jgi:hypothetical protein
MVTGDPRDLQAAQDRDGAVHQAGAGAHPRVLLLRRRATLNCRRTAMMHEEVITSAVTLASTGR